MKVEVETPTEFQGTIQGDLSARRGVLVWTDMRDDYQSSWRKYHFQKCLDIRGTDVVRSKNQGKAPLPWNFPATDQFLRPFRNKLSKNIRRNG